MSKVEILESLKNDQEKDEIYLSMTKPFPKVPIDEALKEVRKRLKYFRHLNKKMNRLAKLEKRKKKLENNFIVGLDV